MNSSISEFDSLVRSKSDGVARATGIDSTLIQDAVKNMLNRNIEQRGITWTRANASRVIHEVIDKYITTRNAVSASEERMTLMLVKTELSTVKQANDRLAKVISNQAEEIAALNIYIEQQKKEIDRLRSEASPSSKRSKETGTTRRQTKVKSKT